jgi:hypothetical protein
MKQGACTWYLEVVQVFTLLGYTVSLADEAILYKFGCDTFTIVAVATDNFTIISESDSSIEFLKQKVRQHWEIMDLRPINWLLGVKISWNLKARTISLCQQSYIGQILACFDLENACTAVTPLEPGVDLSPESPSVSPTLLTVSEKRTYREMIGLLMYITVMTHPDLTFAVLTLSQYLESPHSTHLSGIHQVALRSSPKGLRL